MPRIMRFCVDPRVIAAFVMTGFVAWIIAPALLGTALPVLVALACPVSMAVMAWTMRPKPEERGAHDRSSDGTRAELERLDRKRAELEAQLRAADARDEEPPVLRPELGTNRGS